MYLGRPLAQTLCGCWGEDKKFYPRRDSNPDCVVRRQSLYLLSYYRSVDTQTDRSLTFLKQRIMFGFD
jgi:hypothetical protein